MSRFRIVWVAFLLAIVMLASGSVLAATIRVQSHETGPSEEFMKEQFKKFTEETGIEVVHETVPHAQTLQRTLVYVAGGQAPDIVISSIQYFEALAARGVFVDIAALARQVDPDFDFTSRFFPALLDAYSYNGVLYGVPKDLDTPLLYYNVDMFEQAGVPLPTEDWTFDDLMAAAQKLSTGRGPGRKYGMIVPAGAGGLYYILIPFGGEVLNEDKTECIIDQPAGIAALNWISDALFKYNVSPRPDMIAEIGEPEMMKTARVAMTLQGPWFARYHMTEVPFRWDVSRIPIGPANSTRVGGSGIGITADSKHKEAAWKFVEWFTRPEQQLIWARELGWFPTGLAATQLPGFADPEVLMMSQKQKEMVVASVENGRPQRVIERQGEMYAIIEEELGLLWTQERTPEEVAKAIKARVDALLQGR